MTSEGVPVTCPREDCKHEWIYKGKSRWITCPVCRKLFKNPCWKRNENGVND